MAFDALLGDVVVQDGLLPVFLQLPPVVLLEGGLPRVIIPHIFIVIFISYSHQHPQPYSYLLSLPLPLSTPG